MGSTIEIEYCNETETNWKRLLALIHSAFYHQESRINPPSSVSKLTEESLFKKAKEEQLILANKAGEVVGCVYVKIKKDALYIGKLAVSPNSQREGIGRLLMQEAENYAKQKGLLKLELGTRVELVENHLTFAKLGFAKTSDGIHEGFDRPTYINMEKQLNI